MIVSVIAVLPTNDALRNSAAAATQGEMGLDVSNAAAPAALQLDANYPAIPIGDATAEGMVLEAMSPQQSQGFVVRGTVDIDPENPPSTVDGVPIFADPTIDLVIICPGDPPMGAWQDVAANLAVQDLVAKSLTGDGVAIGVMDNGINLAFLASQLGWTPALDTANSWNLPGSGGTAGAYPTDHGSMCAFDALIAAPNATLVDFAIMSGAGGKISDALAAYSQVLSSWSGGGLSQYKAVVLTNSWSIMKPALDFPPGNPGRYVDNPNHPFNLIVGSVVRAGVDVVFCAGNCGADCPDSRCGGTTGSIVGANALSQVFTIAGCDITGVRVGYSSQGPSIAGMDQWKPDITAYTHFLGSQAFGAGSPDSGTSAACPVAAGCVAAIRTQMGRGTDSNTIFGAFRANTGAGAWDANYGYGIINPVAAATSLGL